jgi:hypothetical protein
MSTTLVPPLNCQRHSVYEFSLPVLPTFSCSLFVLNTRFSSHLSFNLSAFSSKHHCVTLLKHYEIDDDRFTRLRRSKMASLHPLCAGTLAHRSRERVPSTRFAIARLVGRVEGGPNCATPVLLTTSSEPSGITITSMTTISNESMKHAILNMNRFIFLTVREGDQG